MMMISEMAFVFHKSKQALTRATLKKLSKKINTYVRLVYVLISDSFFVDKIEVPYRQGQWA